MGLEWLGAVFLSILILNVVVAMSSWFYLMVVKRQEAMIEDKIAWLVASVISGVCFPILSPIAVYQQVVDGWAKKEAAISDERKS